LAGALCVQVVGVHCCADAGKIEAVGIPADCGCKVVAEAAGCVPAAGIGQLVKCLVRQRKMLFAPLGRQFSTAWSVIAVSAVIQAASVMKQGE